MSVVLVEFTELYSKMSIWSMAAAGLLKGKVPVISGLGDSFKLVEDGLGNGVFLETGPSERFMWSCAPLGLIAEASRFAALSVREDCLFWMVPSAGSDLAKMPSQTCWLMVERGDGTYTMVVPLPSESTGHYLVFRDGVVQVYSENGEPREQVSGGLCVYLAHGESPDALIEAGARSISKLIPTAKLRRNKKTPVFADKFGWCTWNAFYAEVSHEKVRQGLESFKKVGLKPRFMVLDDGWQQTEPSPTGGVVLAGFGTNEKFPGGLKPTVTMAKDEFGVEALMVWHAISGYWKGLSPEKFPQYKPKGTQVVQGGYNTLQAVMDWQNGYFSYVPSKKSKDFYNDYHATLAAEGVDGVKVDNQASLVYLGSGNGGRTRLIKTVRDALDSSVEKHFGGNMISCMAHAPEIWYNAKFNNMSRGSDDFYPRRPETHGMHLYTNAMTGAWFGEFMWIDWDMFESTNPFGPYHAAGRAVSGSPIYVADKPGENDVGLIRKLVFSDGSVSRCEAPGRPTLDCLFHDLIGERMALKVYGTTEAGAAVGLFDIDTASDSSIPCSVSPSDVPSLKGSRYGIWLHERRSCTVVGREDRVVVNLGSRKYDVATIVPVRYGNVAVFGLVNMFNAAAAVVEVSRSSDGLWTTVKLRDGGTFGAWTKAEPQQVKVNGKNIAFVWKDGMLEVNIDFGGACEVALKFH